MFDPLSIASKIATRIKEATPDISKHLENQIIIVAEREIRTAFIKHWDDVKKETPPLQT